MGRGEMKRTIGLVGNSGAGKSTVARYLEELGADIIDADRISHELCEIGQPGHAAVRETFGNGFFRGDGTLNRRTLGAYVFEDKDALEQLNAILHPLVLYEVRRKREVSTKDVVVVDCALLVDAGLVTDVDEVWLVSAGEGRKKKRILKRDGIDERHAENRLKNQMREEELKEHADVVIENDGTLEQLKKQIGEYYHGKNGKQESSRGK